MKKILLLILIATGIASCGTSNKRIEQQLSAGRYDTAINNALDKLSNNKERKRKQESILLLKTAFDKAAARDINTIELLQADANPENYERIYNLFQTLNNRQEAIKPVLPLVYNGKPVNFKFDNYNSSIVNYKDKTATYLYDQANGLLTKGNKYDARKAYEDFEYIDKINPNFKNVRSKMQEALAVGQDYILMSLRNETEQIIPSRLQEELLNISTYGLNDKWTIYHNNEQENIDYDYQMSLIFNNIILSPEQVKERELIQEKLVKDGFEYELDRNGNVRKDSLGNDIKKDKFTKVNCQYFETRQFKTATVTAMVEFQELQTQQLLDRFPLESTYLFEHFYATYRGDKRALQDSFLSFINNSRVPFPSNEQMVYDTGEDLKLKLKNIISTYGFNR
jgi:hypothetical protein